MVAAFRQNAGKRIWVGWLYDSCEIHLFVRCGTLILTDMDGFTISQPYVCPCRDENESRFAFSTGADRMDRGGPLSSSCIGTRPTIPQVSLSRYILDRCHKRKSSEAKEICAVADRLQSLTINPTSPSRLNYSTDRPTLKGIGASGSISTRYQ